MIRNITRKDIEHFNDGDMYDYSLRGLAVELDGQPVAVAGVLHTTPLQVFSSISEELRDYPVIIMKTAKRLLNIMKLYDAPLYALADVNESNSEAFLQRLGFEFFNENEQGRFYQWLKQ